MSTLNNEEFDTHLANEFSRLGFNYQDLKANGTRDLGQGKSQMFLIDYLDSPSILADGIAIIFTVTNPVNEQQPVIETMSATLFNDSCYEKFTAMVEKQYSLSNSNLPTKEQVIMEMTEMLKIKQIKEKFRVEINSPGTKFKIKKR